LTWRAGPVAKKALSVKRRINGGLSMWIQPQAEGSTKKKKKKTLMPLRRGSSYKYFTGNDANAYFESEVGKTVLWGSSLKVEPESFCREKEVHKKHSERGKTTTEKKNTR